MSEARILPPMPSKPPPDRDDLMAALRLSRFGDEGWRLLARASRLASARCAELVDAAREVLL